MSTQQNEQMKILKEAHARVLAVKAMILEAQLQIVKMKTAALKARAQALKNLALVGHTE